MFVIGIVLVLLSAGALVAVLASGTDDQAAIYSGSIHLPTLVVFLAGAGALLLFITGLDLVRAGLKRAGRNRRNNRRLRKLEKREDARQDGSGPTAAPEPGGARGEATGGPAGGPTGSAETSGDASEGPGRTPTR